jgi:hypothetical protein
VLYLVHNHLSSAHSFRKTVWQAGGFSADGISAVVNHHRAVCEVKAISGNLVEGEDPALKVCPAGQKTV